MRYLLGLDAGNTVIKAVLFDLDGKQIAMHALDGQTAIPEPGFVERDLNELWRNAHQAIRACIDKAGIDARDIAGVGCAGHGNGLYLLDSDCEPLLGIQSLDSRAARLADELAAGETGDQLQQICLQKPWPSQTPTLLAWVKREKPELYARAAAVLLCKDFLTYKLTGRLVSDVSDMSGCGLVRMPDCVYDRDLLRLYGLEDSFDKLPDLLEPSDVVGHVTAEASVLTGLNEGTPVVAGFFDVVACALGSGVVANGQASVIVGTWSINQVVSAEPVAASVVFMVSGFGKGRYLNIESSATSAANLEWYVREFIERSGHHEDPFGYCNQLVAETEPAPDDPMYHPFLYGARLGSEMRAGFYGIAGWHTEGHMLRALYEGVMFEHRRHIEVLTAAGVRFDDVILSGGGARSQVWPQIFADGLGKPVTIAACQETGALGAAIAAGCGAGVVASYEAGVEKMTRAKKSFTPNRDLRKHYDRRYELFIELGADLRRFWSKLRDA
ncbi:MAG: carbohydrate kinase [Hoeflea sp.]|uniref:FGGY-family carbohydrate kinase n=1 Tax=Hoeflea sp. TaxID=1940281 RepID=UPI001DE2B924|nr:FGGY-family carbohydrate kinase [Hoeflea sp.]MBU4531905.1 carbohydrate kinase [Alphaproteobacteria bacterium]MBU4546327.1 carbohydrate kinase [Alphaproteobacteria bacterium]MBU4549456.1 carbohydrate kinase [Alphaproteobacteria bacterium]MBV1722631.1 carbohydrate kinase [Hoeflea sp.]MBV1782569.1 carbohydrate kinase [Hoeflea sp.]